MLIYAYSQMEEMTFSSISESILCHSIINRLSELGVPIDFISVNELKELLELYKKEEECLVDSRQF